MEAFKVILEDPHVKCIMVKSSIAFTPPVIKKDSEVKPEEEMKTQDELKETKTAIGAFDVKGNDEAGGTVLKAVEEIAAPEPPKHEEEQNKIFEVVEQQPQFPGGSVNGWLADHIKYPVVAAENGISGRVLMSQELDYQDFNNMLRFQRLSHVDVHFETTKYFLTCDRDLSVQMQINAALTNNVLKVRERKEIPQDFTFNKVGFTSVEGSDQVDKLWNSLPSWAFDSYDIVRSFDSIIELNALGASKGNALMDLASRLKVNQKDVMVFGDQGNDLSMFENPNFMKIAMGNAISDIKEKADYVTDDNDHNGIAKAIKKFVL